MKRFVGLAHAWNCALVGIERKIRVRIASAKLSWLSINAYLQIWSKIRCLLGRNKQRTRIGQESPTEQPACSNRIFLTKFHFYNNKKTTIFDPNRLFVRAQRPETSPTRDLATHGWKKPRAANWTTGVSESHLLNQIPFLLQQKNGNIWSKSVVCKGARPRNAPGKRLGNTCLKKTNSRQLNNRRVRISSS